MSEIINLARARKQRARASARAQAAENRVRFGRSKAEREMAEITRLRADRSLDGHQRED